MSFSGEHHPMRKLPILAAAATVAITAIAASSSAQAAYSLIRWQDTGFCQIWDHSIPTQPFPSNYKTVSAQMPTLLHALNAKSGMLAKGTCTF
jgi:hypothetical protein